MQGSFDDRGRLALRGMLADGWALEAVALRIRGTKQVTRVETPARGSVDVVVEPPAEIPREAFSMDVFLDLVDPDGQAVRRRLAADGSAPSTVASGTDSLAGRPAWWYATRDAELSVRVGVVQPSRLLLDVTDLRAAANGFAVSADLTTVGADGARAVLEATLRSSDFVTRLPLEVGPPTREPTSQRTTHRVTATVDLAALMHAGLPHDEQALDFAIVVPADDGTELRRGLSLADDTEQVQRLAPVVQTTDGVTQVLVPQLTFKSKNLHFARELFTEDAYRYLTRLRRLGPLWTLVRAFSSVWLVGETPYKAQDAGFHLFRWIRRQHPRRRVHYVIAADSPERAAVEALGRVVTMRSREHIRACFLARRFATSHKVDFILATNDRRAVRWMRGNRVFLQHGVLGAKNMVDTYGRLSPAFHTDYFHVSSPRERELIVNDLRYRPSQVRVTGLSRFDRLLEPAQEPPRGLLVVPTWRDWLNRPAAFAESEFLHRWRDFLTSRPLREAIAEGLPVTVILHPNMRFFGGSLAVEGVTVLGQGDTDVQTLMRTHEAMVTDYSSVGFDFAAQGRPVFYHQFDRQQFLGKRPSHLDLDLDLPGEVFREVDPLARAVVDSWRDGFPQKPEHARRAGRFIAPARGSYCEQVYDSVRTARSPWVPVRRWLDSAHGRRAYVRFRTGRLYRPAMNAISTVGRLLPRRDLVVFESDTGRAAADSPRAIYDELVGRGSRLATVWSTRSTFRPLDVTTRKVEPDSPAFHWHLARARYWVNNQNFGPMVTPARRTTYLQTWHGTPLKRMQFDAVSTTGRAEGYLDRVARKTGTWSVLLSPSPYATAAFRSAFRYEGPVLEVGYPRNDHLAGDPAAQGELARRRLGIGADRHVILYAPTFRDDVKQGRQFAWDGAIDWEALVPALSDRTVVLVRRHSVVRGSLRIPPELEDRVVDVSDHPDVQDLLCAADVLVTDYSSVMFDYAILDRPIVLFCYDLEHYRDDLRGFYLDLEAEAPGPVVTTQEQLTQALVRAEDGTGTDEFAPRRRAFRERFAPLDDGRATQRVVDEVFGVDAR
ncbi:CDP-glycerol glycerophosphotransferase family protein [Aeromicrobium flavum]|uniref:CDP-glycerol glycerophosphotransferase family protein n=1 Tax=Aeromicrobium flavum TaxID=416568 RepID=UPI0011BF240B|nr:CDP-glycerol glycerophosphotransferase family protein [Aeromicrobium flavum]